ncbi:MAG TPA: hypothetical protein VMB49_01750 [Acidobacteriaceae bacterium]|nr:hypothetical protein [Acidobacteriaceae bacterium]
MNRSVSRFAYRLLLGMHPASFQNEFGAEMLWIFEEESRQGAVSHLLLDGALSLLRQHWRIKRESGMLSICSGEVIANPGVGAVRLLQAGLTLCAILGSVMFLSGPAHSFDPSIRWSAQEPCYTISLQPVTHMAEIRRTLP